MNGESGEPTTLFHQPELKLDITLLLRDEVEAYFRRETAGSYWEGVDAQVDIVCRHFLRDCLLEPTSRSMGFVPIIFGLLEGWWFCKQTNTLASFVCNQVAANGSWLPRMRKNPRCLLFTKPE
jgi:hypothetical protein